MRISPLGKRRLVHLLLCVAAVATAVVVYRMRSAAWNTDLPATPILSVSEAALFLGDVWEQERLEWRVPVHNPSDENLTIAFSASCACSAVEPAVTTIAAHQQKQVRLVLDLRRSSSDPGESDVRDLSVVLSAVARGYRPQSWEIKGRVRKSLQCTPSPLIYQREIVRDEAASQKVRIAPRVPLRGLYATCNPALAKVEVRALENTGEFELDVCVLPQRSGGPLKFNVDLYPLTKDPPAMDRVSLPVEAEIVEPIAMFPSAIQLGLQRVGDLGSEQLTLASRTKDTLEVLRIEWKSPAVVVSRQSSQVPIFLLQVPIENTGPQSIEGFALVKTGSEPMPIRLPLRIHYYGLAKR